MLSPRHVSAGAPFDRRFLAYVFLFFSCFFLSLRSTCNDENNFNQLLTTDQWSTAGVLTKKREKKKIEPKQEKAKEKDKKKYTRRPQKRLSRFLLIQWSLVNRNVNSTEIKKNNNNETRRFFRCTIQVGHGQRCRPRFTEISSVKFIGRYDLERHGLSHVSPLACCLAQHDGIRGVASNRNTAPN